MSDHDAVIRVGIGSPHAAQSKRKADAHAALDALEARVTMLEAELYRTRKAGNEAVDLALAVYGWAVYPRNGAELRMKADRLRAALTKEDTDE